MWPLLQEALLSCAYQAMILIVGPVREVRMALCWWGCLKTWMFPRMDFSLLKYMNSESFWSPLYPSPGAYPKENCSVNHIYRCMENASLVLRSVLSMLETGPGGK